MSWSSPCRRKTDGRRHHCSWWHAELVTSYRAARDAQEDERHRWEAGTANSPGRADEDFYAHHKRVTFRDWLVWSAGESRAAEAA